MNYIKYNCVANLIIPRWENFPRKLPMGLFTNRIGEFIVEYTIHIVLCTRRTVTRVMKQTSVFLGSSKIKYYRSLHLPR